MHRMTHDRPPPQPRLLSVGSYRPERRVGNEEVARWLSVEPRWVAQRTGISERRFAGPQEDVESMALGAASNAIAAAGIDPQQIDLLILASQSNLLQAPQLAPLLAERLGVGQAGSYDLKAACAGFCLGLAAACDHIRSGSARTVLVVACEQISPMLDRTDRETAGVFGDGAGAALVGAGEVPGVGPVRCGSDGSAGDALGSRPGWFEFLQDRDGPRPFLAMDGRRLATWLIRHLPAIAADTLRAGGVAMDDLRVLILHQANGRLTDMLLERMALPAHVVVARDIRHTGNTGAASVPLAMEQLLRRRLAHPGDLAMLIGYGAGISYCAQLVELPPAWQGTDMAGAR
jgi:3-oxoacyl-[acyl-carrier-protein] synthase-3